MTNWDKITERWLPLVEEMERMGFEDYAIPELYRAAEAHIEQHISIKVSDGDVWLVFPNVTISIEGICKFGTPGQIVRNNLRAWRDKVLKKQHD